MVLLPRRQRAGAAWLARTCGCRSRMRWPGRGGSPRAAQRLDLAALGRLEFRGAGPAALPGAAAGARRALQAGGGAPRHPQRRERDRRRGVPGRPASDFLDIAAVVGHVLDEHGATAPRYARGGAGSGCPRPRRRHACLSPAATAQPPDVRPPRPGERLLVFNALPSPRTSRSPFVIVLGVLVFIHELGHYLAARWCGVHVEAFSIGFGRALASWTDRHGTAWKLAWLPLGGYVKLHGQERPEDVGADVRALWHPGPHLPREAGRVRARSSSRPGRSPISCWRRCCSRCCSRPPASR